jgi:segregation and condensation protein B
MTPCVSTTRIMEREELKNIIECLLFFSDKPLSMDKLGKIIEIDNCDEITGAVEDLKKEYELRNSGLQVINIAEGYQICTRSEFSSWVSKLYKSQITFQLSLPALETLSIIAYKQPVTRGEIEKIRGVDTSCVLRTLLERKLIRISGRKKLPGRPILYGTTREFLRYFGLRDLSEIPSLEEIKPPVSG